MAMEGYGQPALTFMTMLFFLKPIFLEQIHYHEPPADDGKRKRKKLKIPAVVKRLINRERQEQGEKEIHAKALDDYYRERAEKAYAVQVQALEQLRAQQLERAEQRERATFVEGVLLEMFKQAQADRQQELGRILELRDRELGRIKAVFAERKRLADEDEEIAALLLLDLL